MERASLKDLPAFFVGHAQDSEAMTGCTVVAAPEGAVCGVDVRGGGPATRETDLLKPENMVERVHSVVLSGGSAFGLEASCGVMDELAQRGIGFSVGPACVPIVVGACLFDLLVGSMGHPDKAMGAEACRAAFAGAEATDEPLACGNVGAGCGASVGKLLGPDLAMKSGFGWHCVRSGDVVVAALVAVNAVGSVRDAAGRWIAGCRKPDGSIMDADETIALLLDSACGLADGGAAEKPEEQGHCANTTIGAVLTNATLTKAQAVKVSSMAHDAYARRIKPVHTLMDGDTIFTMSSCDVSAQTDLVGSMACEAMEGAIEAAVREARGLPGLPSANDVAR